jgi:glutamine amidotransferase
MERSVPFREDEALGVGSYDDSNVLLAKRPGGIGPRAIARVLDGQTSPALLAAGREEPMYTEEAIAPFRFRQWLFAVDGAWEGDEGIREAMEAALPSFLRRSLRTTTCGERIFSLFLGALHEGNQLDDPHVEGREVARSLARAVRALDGLTADAGRSDPMPLGIVATNGRILVGSRRGRPLSYLLAEGSGVCTLCGVDERAQEDDPRVRPHRRARSVALAGHPLPAGGFVEVPDKSLVSVGRSLDLNVSSL